MNRNYLATAVTGLMLLAAAPASAADIEGFFDGDFAHAGGLCYTIRLIGKPTVYAIDVTDLRRLFLVSTINMKATQGYKVRIRVPEDVPLPRGDMLAMKAGCASGDGETVKPFSTIEDVWGTKP